MLPSNSSLEDAVMAVKEGAGKTRKMKAKLLGTNIVCGGGEGRVGVPPDPGAWGVANLVVGFQRLHVLHVTPCGRLLLVHSCFKSSIFMDLLYEITIVCPVTRRSFLIGSSLMTLLLIA